MYRAMGFSRSGTLRPWKLKSFMAPLVTQLIPWYDSSDANIDMQRARVMESGEGGGVHPDIK